MPYFYSSGLQNTRGSFFLVTNMFPAILTLTFLPPSTLHTITPPPPTLTLWVTTFQSGPFLFKCTCQLPTVGPAFYWCAGWLDFLSVSLSLLTVRSRSPGSSFASVFRWVPAGTVQVLAEPHCQVHWLQLIAECERFVNSQIAVWVIAGNSSLVLLAFLIQFSIQFALILGFHYQGKLCAWWSSHANYDSLQM